MEENYHKTIYMDIETTGLVPKIMVEGKNGKSKKEQIPYETGFREYPYIVSMAWKIDGGETKELIFNQEGREIPQESIDIHKITNEIANKSETLFCDGMSQFIDEASESEIMVGHGLYFNTSIIKANMLREVDIQRMDSDYYDVLTEILRKDKRIDTMRSTAKMMRKWPTLSELHQKIFRKGFDAHSAKEDVEAIYRCYQWLSRKTIVPTWEKLQEKKKENG